MSKNVEITDFKILDLFCGAGGFSYGMEKNPHFKTVISLDNDSYVGVTFKRNMPDCDVIIGDITCKETKERIFEEAKKPDTPVSPQKTRTIIIGFLLGK